MAKDFSFDVVSEVNLQEIDDAVNVAVKEISNRFDFKGTSAGITFNRNDKIIEIIADSDFQLEQVKQILVGKLTKRAISPKVLAEPKREDALGGTVREKSTLVCGIDKELAKKIIKDIKSHSKKIQASIQQDKLRISSRDKDSLQEVIRFLKEKDYPIPMQFTNYR